MKKMIYFDNASTTKVDDRVLEEMVKYYSDVYSNPSSVHSFGNLSLNAVKIAREQVSELITCNTNELIFTSGATEAINFGIKGYVHSNNELGKHIITVSTEHKAVLDTCNYLETIGYEITFLPVNKNGLIDIEQLKSVIKDDTILIAIMFVNNEIGVIQDIKKISDIAHEKNICFFCDATQAVGKIPINVENLGIDMMAFSAHKFYGPKGVGALYVNNKFKKITPLIHGGGQELGLRSGTLNVPGIVGLGKACEIAISEMTENEEKIYQLKNYLENEMLKFPNFFINGNGSKRIFNITNICFPGLDSNIIISKLINVSLSNGSACTSNTIESSHVLKSMGLNNRDAYSSIRFSLGKFNIQNEIITTLKLFNELTKLHLPYA